MRRWRTIGRLGARRPEFVRATPTEIPLPHRVNNGGDHIGAPFTALRARYVRERSHYGTLCSLVRGAKANGFRLALDEALVFPIPVGHVPRRHLPDHAPRLTADAILGPLREAPME